VSNNILSGVRARQNNRGLNVSPWKIPHLIGTVANITGSHSGIWRYNLPLINDHLLKTIFAKDHLCAKATW